MIAVTPAPPYYAVIFTSQQTDTMEGYIDMADKMEALAKQQEGYLGIESARNSLGITISYWKDEQSILKWKLQTDHLIAQQKGITKWYSHYHVRICKVERAYDFKKPL